MTFSIRSGQVRFKILKLIDKQCGSKACQNDSGCYGNVNIAERLLEKYRLK